MAKRKKPVIQGFERTSRRTTNDDVFSTGGISKLGVTEPSDDGKKKNTEPIDDKKK